MPPDRITEPARTACHNDFMHFTTLTITDLGHDDRIATLGRGLGALRFALGEGPLRLSTGDIQDFGFPTFESYVREALGRTGRWGADVRGLVRRLRDLPHLRAPLASGRLSLSVVELVARLATSDDEAEWVDRVTTAPGLNVRQLRAELKDRKLEVCDEVNRRAWGARLAAASRLNVGGERRLRRTCLRLIVGPTRDGVFGKCPEILNRTRVRGRRALVPTGKSGQRRARPVAHLCGGGRRRG